MDSSSYYHEKGIKLFLSGDYSKAESFFKKSLDIKFQTTPDSTNVNLVSSYNNLGLLRRRFMDYDSALILFRTAQQISDFNNNKIFSSTILSNIGGLYRLQGEFAIAKENYNASLTILNNTNNNNEETVLRKAEVYLRLGMLEVDLKNFLAAKTYFQEGLTDIYNLAASDQVLNITYTFHDQLSSLYLILGQPDSALYYIEQSYTLITKHEISPIKRYRLYQCQADYYSYINKDSTANLLINNALDILDSIQAPYDDRFKLRNYYANYKCKLHEYSNAISEFSFCLKLISTDSFNTHNSLDYIISKPYAIELLSDKAKCRYKYYLHAGKTEQLEKAISELEVVAQLINHVRNSFLSIESKLWLAENEAAVYNLGLKCAHILWQKTGKQDYLNTAFQFAELNKSSVLSSVLQKQDAQAFAGIPSHLIKKEKKLQREITFYKEQIYEESAKVEPDSTKIAIWNNYLVEFSKDDEALKKLLENDYPKYYHLKYKHEPGNLIDIQKSLNWNTSVVEYALTDSSLFTFVINRNKVQLFERNFDSAQLDKLKKLIAIYGRHQAVNESGYGNEFNAYQNTAYSVYQDIFPPYELVPLKKNIIIVPDGLLSYIPFEALTCSAKKSAIQSYADLDYLFYHHNIYYSYSSSLVSKQKSTSHKSLSNKVLAMSPSYNEYKDAHLQKNRHYQYRSGLSPLPFALKEANIVANMSNGKLISGKMATEEAFLNRAPNFDILHLAMHTIIDDKNPLYSKLAFYAPKDSLKDGFLNTREVFDLNLNAKMTVLSACNSGDGDYSKGEGVISLARSFFYAGCPSLLMTLWQVEDTSGLMLMESYYSYLMKGYSKSKALSKAKAHFLKNSLPHKQHPFFWSSYICIGDNSAIYYNRKRTITISIIIALVVWAGIECFYKRRKAARRDNLDLP